MIGSDDWGQRLGDQGSDKPEKVSEKSKKETSLRARSPRRSRGSRSPHRSRSSRRSSPETRSRRSREESYSRRQRDKSRSSTRDSRKSTSVICVNENQNVASNSVTVNVDALSNILLEKMRDTVVQRYWDDRRSRSKSPRRMTRSKSRSPIARCEQQRSRVRERSLNEDSEVASYVEQQQEIRRLSMMIDQLQNSTSKSYDVGNFYRKGEEKLIPIYDPSRLEMSVQTWIKRVEAQSKMRGWSSIDTMTAISYRLEGHAAEWLRTYDGIDWEVAKEELIKRFGKIEVFESLMKKAIDYKAYPGQLLSDYCFKKSALIDRVKAKFTDKQYIDLIIGGIPDEEIARAIRAARLDDLGSFNAHMYVMDKMPELRYQGDKDNE
ncbi:hypothetical protein HCN44_009848 [Aphidius gifuensis]|uniref:Retrotransposon gag domain-containing protein n=1 Tax=Aphidius gifuensis TaxID=684658 RepID=A0A835CW66_APHGI|nr:hypothetical protein HCN44_009848 [Aphidius gifuensis]